MGRESTQQPLGKGLLPMQGPEQTPSATGPGKAASLQSNRPKPLLGVTTQPRSSCSRRLTCRGRREQAGHRKANRLSSSSPVVIRKSFPCSLRHSTCFAPPPASLHLHFPPCPGGTCVAGGNFQQSWLLRDRSPPHCSGLAHGRPHMATRQTRGRGEAYTEKTLSRARNKEPPLVSVLF